MTQISHASRGPAITGPPGANLLPDLLRQAAEAGPGFRGVRRDLSPNERRKLADSIRAEGDAVPAFLESPAEWVERRAKLFEAGDYPDKGVTLAEEDLRRLADGFEVPVPVLIEHAESPLELGFLTQVESSGPELLGTISLTKEADALVERSGARSLSLGLSKDLTRILEVSLVRTPRIESARLFRSELCFWSELSPEDGEPVRWQARFEELERRCRHEESSRKVAEWLREGQLTPAQAPFAHALLTHGGRVEFDGRSRSVQELVFGLVENQPRHGLFEEMASGARSPSDSLFLPEEAEFYRKHFPDVSLDAIAAKKAGK